MKFTILIFFTLVLMSINLLAYEVPAFCLNLKNSPCDCDVNNQSKARPFDLAEEIPTDWMNPLKELTFIDSKIEKIYKAQEVVKHFYLDLFRTMRDGKSEPTYNNSMEEISRIKDDFTTLTKLSIETNRLKNKFNYCINNCSRARSLEIEDSLKYIQKMKMAVLLKTPILAHKNFEDLMSNMNEKQVFDGALYNDKIFEENLKNSLFDNLQKMDSHSKEFSKYFYDLNKPIIRENNKKYAEDYSKKLVENFPIIMEELVNSELIKNRELKDYEKQFVCSKAKALSNYYKNQKMKEVALDVSLLILPLLTGPLTPFIEAEIIPSIALRLARFGLKEDAILSALKGGAQISNLSLMGKEALVLNELSKKCKHLDVKLLNDSKPETYQDIKSCEKELSDKMLMLEIGAALNTATSFSNETLAFLNYLKLKLPKIALPSSQSLILQRAENDSTSIAKYIYTNGIKQNTTPSFALEFHVPNQGTFSVMDLSKLNTIADPALKKVPEEYWRFVGNVYKERLNLTPAEIEGFIKSSIEANNRTKLIINTEKSLTTGQAEFRGGVGLVQSKNGSELLPLEKATGMKITRMPNEKIAEIVRLTASKNVEAEKTSQALIQQLLGLISNDKEIGRVFIYTSRVHARLYKKMGVPGDKIKQISDRDVLIELDRSAIEKVFNSKLMEPKTSFLHLLNRLIELVPPQKLT
jgi:hypothetical protein